MSQEQLDIMIREIVMLVNHESISKKVLENVIDHVGFNPEANQMLIELLQAAGKPQPNFERTVSNGS